MWIVFEVVTIGEMKPISVGLDSKEDAISFRKTMLEGTKYKGSNLTFAYVEELEECAKQVGQARDEYIKLRNFLYLIATNDVDSKMRSIINKTLSSVDRVIRKF